MGVKDTTKAEAELVKSIYEMAGDMGIAPERKKEFVDRVMKHIREEIGERVSTKN
jgi:hypothetical protein